MSVNPLGTPFVTNDAGEQPVARDNEPTSLVNVEVDGSALKWLVFNIGCIECSVSSNVVGVYATTEEARRVADLLNGKLSWREGGQNYYEVFDLSAPQADEYRTALAGGAT